MKMVRFCTDVHVDNFAFPRKSIENILGKKNHENIAVLRFFDVNNFDFPKKLFSKKENFSKLNFCNKKLTFRIECTFPKDFELNLGS